MAEIQEQAQGVKLRQFPSWPVPLFYKFRGLWRWRKKGLQARRGVVVEAEISGGELFFQDRHSGKQGERSTLHAVRWAEPYFAFALEEGACNPSANVLCKGQRSVFEIEMEVRAVDGGLTNVIDTLGIEAYGTDAGVEAAGGLGTLGIGRGGECDTRRG